MFTPLEKVQINFPDISFQKRTLWRGMIATVPNVYKITADPLRTRFSDSACRVNKCLSDLGAEERTAWFVEPLSVTGKSEADCAQKIIEEIETGDVARHAITDQSNVIPQSGVPYFTVHNDDPFHQHGDPDFIDISPIKHQYGTAEEEFFEEDMILSAISDFLGASLFGEELGGRIEIVGMTRVSGPFADIGDDRCHVDDVVVQEIVISSGDAFGRSAMLPGADCDDEGAIMFDINYGPEHAHFIDAPTLAARLEA